MRIDPRFMSLCIATFIALATSSSRADIVFSEDFDDIILTSDPLELEDDTPGSAFTTNVTTNSNSRVAARTLGSNPFGAGNQFLEVIDGSGTTAGLRGPTTSTIDSTGFYFRFDFFDPSSTDTGINGETVDRGGRFYLSSASNGSTGSRTIDIDLLNGTIRGLNILNGGNDHLDLGTYLEDQMHTVEIVGNLSAVTINYSLSGNQSAAPGTYDIFLNGNLLAAGNDVSFRNPDVTEVSYVAFGGTGSGTKTVTYYDNILLDNSVPIPEPSGIVLVGMTITGIGLVRMRSRYQ